jgi:D-cysteine desulfhydrase
MSDALADACPRLAARLPKLSLARLPTPVSAASLRTTRGAREILIKHDDVSGELYGGNKVRKLEFLLRRALDHGARRVATFGTVASNHALATALYARSLGLDTTCFLYHQARTPACARALAMHLSNGTTLVPIGGERAEQVATMRAHLQGSRCRVIPAGGSSWLGALGFVNAGLELADQVERREIPAPDALYVANGTMGTAAGLALGLALADLPTEVQAIRVTADFVANRPAMRRLVQKTATLMHEYDPGIANDLADRARYRFRDAFFAGGYAQSDAATDAAVARARDELGLELETTYTGKALAALLGDLGGGRLEGRTVLFWNTYNSRPLPAPPEKAPDTAALPDAFRRYFG